MAMVVVVDHKRERKKETQKEIAICINAASAIVWAVESEIIDKAAVSVSKHEIGRQRIACIINTYYCHAGKGNLL